MRNRDKGYLVRSFHLRPAFAAATATIQGRDRIFSELSTKLRYMFGFMIQKESPWDPNEAIYPAYGITSLNFEYMELSAAPNKTWRCATFLNTMGVEHLMRADINSAEKMMIQWEIAHVVRSLSLFADGLLSDA